jgi:hypothetical protein
MDAVHIDKETTSILRSRAAPDDVDVPQPASGAREGVQRQVLC